MPETRFFHIGVYVYKFKIKYGNTTSKLKPEMWQLFTYNRTLVAYCFALYLGPKYMEDCIYVVNVDLHENIVSEELEEVIRVILGNLDNLCPFTTEHFVIFPYLNKWERVSDLRFRHGDAFLIPYPYVCTLYIELNSSVFLGKEEFRDTCDSVNNRHKPRDNMDTERAIKRKRLEGTGEMSQAQLCVDRNVAKCATCSCNTTRRPIVGFGRMQLQNGKIHKTQNHREEIQNQCSGTTSSGYDDMNLWEHIQYVRTKNTENSQQEGQVPLLPKTAEETVELKTRGFLELLKSTVFPPLLQRIFSGSTDLS